MSQSVPDLEPEELPVHPGCTLPAERLARELADREILRVQAEHTARLAEITDQQAKTAGQVDQILTALRGASTVLRLLLVLAITSAAKLAPELLHTLLSQISP